MRACKHRIGAGRSTVLHVDHGARSRGSSRTSSTQLWPDSSTATRCTCWWVRLHAYEAGWSHDDAAMLALRVVEGCHDPGKLVANSQLQALPNQAVISAFWRSQLHGPLAPHAPTSCCGMDSKNTSSELGPAHRRGARQGVAHGSSLRALRTVPAGLSAASAPCWAAQSACGAAPHSCCRQSLRSTSKDSCTIVRHSYLRPCPAKSHTHIILRRAPYSCLYRIVFQ